MRLRSMILKTREIREQFLDYFKSNAHTIVPSSSLIPGNDPTLLFTNAGMVQFKDLFLGLEARSYTRAVSAQYCVRAGGKHNDLENVGYTARHHTLFEMLGNFSFGDYFKREAIVFAWAFLTKILKLDPEKLWVTVYQDDLEAERIWLDEIKVSKERLRRCGEKDNFWAMGETGPCGPCTEIFYDHGDHIPGGPPGSPDQEGDRYVEIWNLVFMQYNRTPDGKLNPLPKPSVDTGMGLERIAAVMQGVHSNYDIDVFKELIEVLKKAFAAFFIKNPMTEFDKISLQVLADHFRTTAFLIAEGILPSNEGRGYVLRRIMRRALAHARRLARGNLALPFFSNIMTQTSRWREDNYPDLVPKQQYISDVFTQEEALFDKTIKQGLDILEKNLNELQTPEIPGDFIFKLHDTYGFPKELTHDLARERGFTLDERGFEACMQKQRSLSQSKEKFKMDYTKLLKLDTGSCFHGYETLICEASIVALLADHKVLESFDMLHERIGVVLDQTPFYAESGGQIGDVGILLGKEVRFEVQDTQKAGMAIVHYGILKSGILKVGDRIDGSVDPEKRMAIRLHHSATHLLHAALREILGHHVQQKGSIVTPQKTRFDFSHKAPLTPDELCRIESLVNEKIRENLPVETEIMTPTDAKNHGAMALFGEKYGEHVRVLSMGDFSKELCGGTHVARTGDIGFFKIMSDTGVASGVRRIEAAAGREALLWVRKQEEIVQELSRSLRIDPANIPTRVADLLQTIKQKEKEIETLKRRGLTEALSETQLLSHVQKFGEYQVLATRVPETDRDLLRTMMDHLKNKLSTAVIVLACVSGERVQVIAGVSKDIVGRVPPAKTFVQAICGQGGGRPDLAEGGGICPPDLDARLDKINLLLQSDLG